MAQIFHPSTNPLSKASLFGAVFAAAGALWLAYLMVRSSYATQAGVTRVQPVPFSHEHHVGGLGIDCRYCHASVERAAFAGIPPASTCMTCHSQVWTDSPVLEPVRRSARTGEPIAWVRVHDLPDHAYFDHSVHVRGGVGCATCHGPVDRMPMVWRGMPLHMRDCLECHREPERFLRPPEAVFQMDWSPAGDQEALGRELARRLDVRPGTDCSTCHR